MMDKEVFHDAVDWETKLVECKDVIARRNAQIRWLKEKLDRKEQVCQKLESDLRECKKLKEILQNEREKLVNEKGMR